MKWFQNQVDKWMVTCFGPHVSKDRYIRCCRFFEEAAELVQAGGMSREDAHKLVDYTYDRPVGEVGQEVGGVMVTLAAFCNAFEIELGKASTTELIRCWDNIEKIRAKQANKPHNSPLAQ